MMCLATLFLEGKKLPRTIFFVQPLHRFESKIISRIKRDLAPSHLLRNILPLSSSSEVFTQKEIDRIVFDPLHFAKTLSLFDSKESPLLLVGEKYGDWLLALGRINLFHQMVIKVREKGFISIFSGQWKTIVFPKAKPLDMAAYAISQFTLVFAPFMTTLLGQGKAEELHHWIEQLIKWLTVGGVIVFFSVLLLGNDLVPLVLGAAYQPVVTNLLTLFITLWVQVLVNVATLLTVVYNRPKIAMMAAGVRLVAMLVFGPFLITRWGSWGGCLAVLAASVIFSGYLTWRMQGIVSYSLQKWALAIALGLPFLSLLWWQSSWIVNVGLYGIFLIGYCTLLLLLRFIKLSEMVAVWRAIRSKTEMTNWSKS